jgi:uncharacterized protein YcbX
MATVHQLIFYPIKSCAGIAVDQADLAPAGLAHDRSFMVIDPGGRYRSQRKDPRMAVIQPMISPDGSRLAMSTPDLSPLSLAVDRAGARRPVDLFGQAYQGIDQGDEVAAWLSKALRAPSRLVRVPPEHGRVTDGALPGTSGYADSCPILLTSLSSLDQLNQRLAEPVGMDRFRPNIVVAGWPRPHTEDAARRLSIGSAEIGYAKLAVRCAIVTVDQAVGRKRGPEPLRALAGYRRGPGGLCFGAKFVVLRPGRLAVGDEVVGGDDGDQ